VSVGNLTVGGTGKTPLVGEIVARLSAAGHRPSVVSRGYGGRAGRGPLRVAASPGIGLGPAVTGDEPWMLATRFPGVPVLVGSDRYRGVLAAAEDGAGVAVLDDGFQHRRLARDLDIVSLSAERPFGNGRLLPAGPLREPGTSLRRADLIVFVGGDGTDPTPEEFSALGLVPRFGILRARRRPVGFAGASGEPAPRPERAVAFCGIGDPSSFRRAMESLGVALAEFVGFPDHHRFSGAEIAALLDRARREEAPLVTTEKDLARLHDHLRGSPLAERLLALRIELEFSDPAPLARALEETLRKGDGR
jgi:tetraacyldisaccharide 4'-kinase